MMGGVVLASAVAAALVVAQGDAPPAPSVKAPPPPLSIWRPLDGGDAEHLQSGLRCPAELGGARRTTYAALDRFGFDVACGLNGTSAAITLYLTRTDKVDESYEQAKTALTRSAAQLNPQLRAEEALEADGVAWRRATYAFEGDTRSEIWLSAFHGWTLKYRLTYLEADRAAAHQQLSVVTRRVQETAGARLAVCAKSKAPKRSGRLIDPAGLMSSPIMLAALMSQVAAPTPKGGPPVFCAEQAFQVEGDKGFLLWRGIRPDGGDARADRVTATTTGAPPTLDVALDEVGNTITARLSGRRQSRWIGTMGSANGVDVYGFFDSRPSPQTMLFLLDKVVAGEARPIGGYGGADGAIRVGDGIRVGGDAPAAGDDKDGK